MSMKVLTKIAERGGVGWWGGWVSCVFPFFLLQLQNVNVYTIGKCFCVFQCVDKCVWS